MEVTDNKCGSMVDVLLEVEMMLPALLEPGKNEIKSMFIDYHEPHVKRIWFQHGEYRVYLHKLEQVLLPAEEMLFHPHPWESAVKLVKGSYVMGVGHSATDDIPKVDCRLQLAQGSVYQMTEQDGWHYVYPTAGPVYSLMVTGRRFDRVMPVVSERPSSRKLTKEEKEEMLAAFLLPIMKGIGLLNWEWMPERMAEAIDR